MKYIGRHILIYIIFPVFIVVNKASGFDSNGHKRIEQEAYALLRNYQGIGVPKGDSILNWFIQQGILDESLEPKSHYPDLSLERQFAQNRQMYHFMASNGDVLHARGAATDALRQQDLLLSSLEPCLKMMYFFWKETIENPIGASQAGRGIYVLIHVVTDSYSSEHTSRDSSSTEILTVKGWRLSRLYWPKSARSKEAGKTTLLLLHNGFNSPGDKEWNISGTDSLTPLAKSAAIAVRDLLVSIYRAKHTTEKVDVIMTEFIKEHFLPYHAATGDSTFTFSNTFKVIKYAFENDYKNTPKASTFDYDRFPQYSLMLTSQYDFSQKNIIRSFGFEYARYVTPKAADNSKTLFLRIPIGFGIGVSAFPNLPVQTSIASLLRMKGFCSSSFSLPIINATLDPHVGIGIFPFQKSHNNYTSVVAGVDLVMNVGRDWFLRSGGAHRTTRISIGYEYDRWSIPIQHSLNIKIGCNTWQGRVPL